MEGEIFSPFAASILNQKYAHDVGGRKESWWEVARRVATHVMGAVDASPAVVDAVAELIAARKFIPGGRYLYAAGRPYHQTQNCLLNRAGDSREAWAQLLHDGTMGLMSGAGVGANYSQVRPRGSIVSRTGGVATGPIALMQMLNEAGRGIRQGGSRRSAIWAGLSWKHQDIFEFIELKNWREEVRALKEQDFDFPAPMDGTNISVCLDDEFFEAVHNPQHALHGHAQEVYWRTVRQMLKTAEPGFSVDVGANAGEDLRNACTEVTSRDDSDICNLGSLNLARIHSREEFATAVELATAFLIAGTVYSHIPYAKVGEVREKNRRLGLGLMGIHEWLLQRGKSYGPDEELAQWLAVYAGSTAVAADWADQWELSRPVKTRAIAPTGTIGIIAETTTGIEPIFCTAYKRRYKVGDLTAYQLVVDPTAKRLVEQGVSPDAIEDAYQLAGDVERRVAFQAWTQQFVDHGISSTINLPSWGSELNNDDRVQDFGAMLLKHLPNLRGVTCYPDGARGGQPLTPTDFHEALESTGEVFYEQADVCDITKGGSCGV